MIRYYVCGIGYDKGYCVTDYERQFGDFDTYERAYNLFTNIRNRRADSFFVDVSDVYQLCIQLEACEETDEAVECIDVKNEWWIVNPNVVDSVVPETKEKIYNELTRLLTEYEWPDDSEDYIERDWETEMYEMLVKIQNRWEDTITADEQ